MYYFAIKRTHTLRASGENRGFLRINYRLFAVSLRHEPPINHLSEWSFLPKHCCCSCGSSYLIAVPPMLTSFNYGSSYLICDQLHIKTSFILYFGLISSLLSTRKFEFKKSPLLSALAKNKNTKSPPPQKKNKPLTVRC